MQPVIPAEMLSGAMQLVVCFVTAVAALLSFMLGTRA